MKGTLRTDGGARGNPGPAGAGFVLEDESGALITSGGRFLGVTTNNVAEYEALLWGLETALARGVNDLDVYCDSELLCKQISGEYRVRHPNMKPLHQRAAHLLERFDTASVRHVRREDNAAADALANEAMDARGDVGDADPPATPAEQQALFEEE